MKLFLQNKSMFFIIALGIIQIASASVEGGPTSAEDLKGLIGFDIELTSVWDEAERQGAEIFWAQPTTVEQIQKLVAAAETHGLHVRPYGAKHSGSPLFADRGNIGLDLSLLQGNKFTIDKEKMLVSSLASATLGELHEFNRNNSVTIPSGPVTGEPTLQGATGTSAHGSIKEEGLIGTYVYALDLVDSKGRMRHFNYDDHKDVITACKVHLGMCGIIYNTTVKVVSDRVFKFIKSEMKVSDLLLNQENRKDFAMRNYGVNIKWNVFSNATEEEIKARDADKLFRPPDSWSPANDSVTVWSLNPVDDNSVIPNKLVKFAESFQLKDGTVIQGIADYRMASETIIFQWSTAAVGSITRWDVAVATPETEDFSASQKMLENYFDVCETAIRTIGFYRDSFGFFRWTSHKDDCTLCHTKNANDFKMLFEFEYGVACRPCNKNLLNELARDKVWSSTFATRLMSNNSRILPHWAKYYDYIPGIIDHLRQNYGNNFDEFIRTRNQEDLDPDNMFTNSHLRTLFHDAIVGNEKKKSCSNILQFKRMVIKNLFKSVNLIDTCKA
ncbi:unnamed protein product [Owenia fusiformis]|uniref:Uncharacterized protein n=1 Tax=Owenia fusiformis TaxID=6347 RepID=A0A8J1UM13_OWEFU|nr:unnamed protein product [Owenia fusiformis]